MFAKPGLLPRAIGLVAAGLLFTVSPVDAAKRKAAPENAAPGVVSIDPAAVAAFGRMSRHVAEMAAFEFKTTFSFDVVAKTGQTVTVDGIGHYRAKRPDKLAVEVDNDLFHRRYVYDGKTLAIVSPTEKFYAQVPVPATIREMLAKVATDHAVEIPVADLFDLGTDKDPVTSVRNAFFVGTTEIDGMAADHWAFRSTGRDWELWISTGDKPLPLKFTMVDRYQPTHPRYSVTLAWTSRADIPDAEFTFVPASDQKRIGILNVGPSKGSN
jgi:hypothetical protein